MNIQFENDTAENRLAKTFFIIEATDFERHMLWREYHSKVKWEENIGGPSGGLITVGHDNNRPCCISTSWARIDEQLVMFYDNCSRITNHDKTEKWLKENFKGEYNGRRSACGAMNFGQCIYSIEKYQKEVTCKK
jgi:hypothetical protein